MGLLPAESVWVTSPTSGSAGSLWTTQKAPGYRFSMAPLNLSIPGFLTLTPSASYLDMATHPLCGANRKQEYKSLYLVYTYRVFPRPSVAASSALSTAYTMTHGVLATSPKT